MFLVINKLLDIIDFNKYDKQILKLIFNTNNKYVVILK